MLQEFSSGNKLVGIYRGTVLQHLSHGYCKILIHGVYPQEWATEPDNIPKAEQASPLFAGTNNGNGIFSYPNIGSTVWCMFANGDQNLPIYFAAALGGENAFGQHEIVKLSSEEVSQRHLITSGKTHIEWYENGKLSAIVEDPVRTDASVDFNADEVQSRQLQDKVNSEEISNLNCQVVLDNKYARGTISCSTHYWNPTSVHLQSTLTSETDVTSIIENTDSKERFDNKKIIDNEMQSSFDAISCFESSYNKNTTVVNAETSEQIIKTASVQAENALSMDGNNNFIVHVDHERDIQDSYSYVDNKNKANSKLTSLVLQDQYEANFNMRDDATAGLEVISSSMKTTVNQGSSTTVKQDLANALQMNAADGLWMQAQQNITSDFSGQVTIKKNQITLTASNANTANFNLRMSGYKKMNGSDIVSSKFQKKVSTKDGTNDEIFSDKLTKVDFSKKIDTKGGTDVELFIDKTRKVEVSNSTSTASGQLEIQIKDKASGKYSKILMDKAGNITLESSTTVTLRAPNIEIEGITHITGVTTIDSATTIKSSLTTLGDAEIKGSSYTGHVHKYMMPVHPGGQAPTTPRTK